MEKYLDKKQTTALSKSDIAAYVRDMKELELKQFTLKKLKEQCTAQTISQKTSCVYTMKEAEDNLQKATDVLNEALQNKKTKFNQVIEKPKKIRKPPKTGDWAVPFFFLHLFSVGVIVIVLAYILTGTPMSEDLPNNVLSMTYLSAFFGSILMEIVNYKIAKKRYTEYLKNQQEYDQYIDQEKTIKYCQEQYEFAQKNLDKAKKQFIASAPQIDKLDLISEHLEQHISAIETKKNQLYSLNIVPPDYQTLDCMIEFNQMYRNDLVDTVREAVKIYEERVFRGELIRGIDNIYNMLGNLTSTMHNIESALYSVQNEVRRMSDDMNQIASSNKDMLAESRAARYATEALRDTTDRCEWYMNRQYWNH